MWSSFIENIKQGDVKALARCISLVENETDGYEAFMESLPQNEHTLIVGITGPPGAGKSTLTDALIEKITEAQKKVAVLCIDPSSPFNLGALLGDRIRMSEWHNHPHVYIRSLASRGSLGGLNPKIIEITDILKIADFDFIIIETVGVGQSEIEIAGLADITAVVLVPESGDEIQTMKAGLMEIADIFIVNKADRPGADLFLKNLRQMLAPAFQHQNHEIPIVPSIADQKKGIDEILQFLMSNIIKETTKKNWLLVEKVYQLIQKNRMKDIDKKMLFDKIQEQKNDWNLYRFIRQYQN